MIICSCNVISDHDIRGVVGSAGAKPCSAAQVYDCLGCTVQCGQCSRSVNQILQESTATVAAMPPGHTPCAAPDRVGASVMSGDKPGRRVAKQGIAA